MKLNIAALASTLLAVAGTADKALALTEQAVTMIGVVENLGESLGETLSGDAKFQAVMSSVKAVAGDLGLTAKWDDIKAKIAPVINLVVSILNSGGLWKTVFSDIADFAKSAANALTPAAPAPVAHDPTVAIG